MSHSSSHAWPVKIDNVNIASPREREGRGRREKDGPPHGKRDGGMDEEMKTSVKRLMGQIHSKESRDKRPLLADVGQALTMNFSTYLPACALYDRKNTAQINIHRSQSHPFTPDWQANCKALWEIWIYFFSRSLSQSLYNIWSPRMMQAYRISLRFVDEKWVMAHLFITLRCEVLCCIKF